MKADVEADVDKRIAITLAAVGGALLLVLGTVVATLALQRDHMGWWDDDDHPGPGMMSARWGDDDRGGRMGPFGMQMGTPASEASYLADMVAHHEEAVAAAEELARSDRDEMRELGESIVESQTAQIRQMKAWLSRWYPDEEASDYEPMMRDLSGLEGDALDRAFLEDMVPHHMMAVMMSQHLLLGDVAEHDEVADLADSIVDEQRREIVTMTRWYADWFDGRWGGGHMMGGHMMGGHMMGGQMWGGR